MTNDCVFLDVEKPCPGRRFAVGDIHGLKKTLVCLLEYKLQITPADQLFLLGDYVDRGPDSKGVLDYIIGLKSRGFQVYPLIGNHEEDLLDYCIEEERRFLEWHIKKYGMENLLEGDTLAPVYVDFIRSLPRYYRLPDFYLVHAGFNFDAPDPFSDLTAMTQIRRVEPRPEQLAGRRVVHGHDPHYVDEIRACCANRATVLPIDTGAVYNKPHRNYDYSRLGVLTALNLDTFELAMQENVDG